MTQKKKEPFIITKVQHPAKMPTMDQLQACSNGLTRRMKKAKSNLEKSRLRDVKKEIDYLIEVL